MHTFMHTRTQREAKIDPISVNTRRQIFPYSTLDSAVAVFSGLEKGNALGRVGQGS